MEATAITKYVRVSPRKLQLLVKSIRELTPADAVGQLKYLRKSGAVPLKKVIESALANAKQGNIGSESDLQFKQIAVLPAASMKRFRAVSRGMAHEYKKRMSHIRIVLTTTDNKVKTEQKTERKS